MRFNKARLSRCIALVDDIERKTQFIYGGALRGGDPPLNPVSVSIYSKNLIDVPKDGDCFFHAVIRCMAHTKNVKTGNSLLNELLDQEYPKSKTWTNIDQLITWFRNEIKNYAESNVEKLQIYYDFFNENALPNNLFMWPPPKKTLFGFQKKITFDDFLKAFTQYVTKEHTYIDELSFNITQCILSRYGILLTKRCEDKIDYIPDADNIILEKIKKERGLEIVPKVFVCLLQNGDTPNNAHFNYWKPSELWESENWDEKAKNDFTIKGDTSFVHLMLFLNTNRKDK